MSETPVRLDGWKAIAAHFRRNRSTVIRWAEAGDFPVHRMSGRKGGSVWAYAEDLDAWLARHGATSAGPAGAQAGLATPRRLAIAGVAAVVLAAGGLWLARTAVPPASEAAPLPADPAVADLYLKARDDWATRTPEGLHKAMAEYAAVTAREPGYAPAYAGLADAYLLAREFAELPDAVAYPKADAAAKVALTLDPRSAEANRAQAMVDYGWREDARAAREHFERSLRARPNDPQTHFWFGNMLGSHLATDEALAHLREARQLDPGSRAIQADYAYMQWRHGPCYAGLKDLQELGEREPDLASIHRFLAYAYLAMGDVDRYLPEMEHWVRLMGNPALLARAARERAAYGRGGAAGVLQTIADRTRADDLYEWAGEWQAMAVSLLGQRERLRAMLGRELAAQHGGWGNWRTDRDSFTRWRDDPQITAALLKLGVQPVARRGACPPKPPS